MLCIYEWSHCKTMCPHYIDFLCYKHLFLPIITSNWAPLISRCFALLSCQYTWAKPPAIYEHPTWATIAKIQFDSLEKDDGNYGESLIMRFPFWIYRLLPISINFHWPLDTCLVNVKCFCRTHPCTKVYSQYIPGLFTKLPFNESSKIYYHSKCTRHRVCPGMGPFCVKDKMSLFCQGNRITSPFKA